MHDDGGRFGVIEDVADLLADQTEVERHGDQPRFGCGGVNLRPFDRVVSQDRHAIAFGETKPEKSVREPAGARVPLVERHAALEIAGANPLRREARVRR